MSSIKKNELPKLIAFYLTQFHPVPENDKWWGKGFTEWTNVTKAQPLFEGHYQPHLPSDLGFYDLRLREVRREQIEMAKKAGVYGFCYHYYWFSGKRLLELPLDDMLSDPKSDMPFCLSWANENWTRRWDAAEHEVLIAQEYRDSDDLEFIKSLMPYFKDDRYIKINGRPLLIVYRPQHLLDPKRSAEVWRKYCREQGFDGLYICAALTHGNESIQGFGFDAGVEFPPHNLQVSPVTSSVSFFKPYSGNVFEFSDVASSFLNKKYEGEKVFKTVFPSWDNTARTKSRSLVVLNGNPENYQLWLEKTLNHSIVSGNEFVFVNAWNEWAEGCHLEPDQKYGDGFLKATLNAMRMENLGKVFYKSPPIQSNRRFFYDLLEVFTYHAKILYGLLVAKLKKMPRLRIFLRRFFDYFGIAR